MSAKLVLACGSKWPFPATIQINTKSNSQAAIQFNTQWIWLASNYAGKCISQSTTKTINQTNSLLIMFKKIPYQKKHQSVQETTRLSNIDAPWLCSQIKDHPTVSYMTATQRTNQSKQTRKRSTKKILIWWNKDYREITLRVPLQWWHLKQALW